MESQHLQNIKETLERLESLSDDILKDREIQNDKMLVLYNKLLNNEEMRLTWIKKKMPWYIIEGFKISSGDLGLINNTIYIGVSFGKSQQTNCYVRITPKDID